MYLACCCLACMPACYLGFVWALSPAACVEQYSCVAGWVTVLLCRWRLCAYGVLWTKVTALHPLRARWRHGVWGVVWCCLSRRFLVLLFKCKALDSGGVHAACLSRYLFCRQALQPSPVCIPCRLYLMILYGGLLSLMLACEGGVCRGFTAHVESLSATG